MMDARLPRWVVSSVATLLKPVAEDTIGVAYFVEQLDDEWMAAFEQDSVLLRVNGPDFIPGNSVDYVPVKVFVMIIDISQLDENGYTLVNAAGEIANTLSGAIPINRRGDDDTLVGCLVPDRRSREFVRILNYGVIEKDMRVRQTGVLANYELSFC